MSDHNRRGSHEDTARIIKDGWPEIPKALADYLDTVFPVRTADPNHSERRVWIEVGKRYAIEAILQAYAEQNPTR